jgi:hypothetical protein
LDRAQRGERRWPHAAAAAAAPRRLPSPAARAPAVAAGGEVAQRWRVSLPGGAGVLRKWPREAMEAWGGWAMLALFVAILVWEEVRRIHGHTLCTWDSVL